MRLDIRPMTAADLQRALDWAKAEGWNPGLDDAPAFHAADPAGFLMGWLGDTPIVSISAVEYGAAFGFIGLYICRPEYRGHGYGKAIWDAAMARMGTRTVGLDGVLAQIANYERSGFVLVHRNRRYGGQVIIDTLPDPRVVPVTTEVADAIVRLDEACFRAPREVFVRRWLTGAPSRTALAMLSNGAVTGYGVIRQCVEGWKIGPLFADSVADADALFRALVDRAPRGATVFLDVPGPNAAAIALAQRYGMTEGFETARMYRGPDPALPLDRIFGITTFELG